MENKSLRLAFLLAIIALVAWLWLLPKQHTPNLKGETQSLQTNKVQGEKEQKKEALAASKIVAGTQNPSQPRVNDRDKPDAFVQSIEEKNSPIRFYGKILDQDSNPVSGVKVIATVRQWYVRSVVGFDTGAHFIPIERKTEADGRFEINGEKGDGFGIEYAPKDGYDLSPRTSHGYGTTSGSFENPVIIKMWKKGESAQLVSQDKDTRIPYDGTPVVFDLLAGQKITGDSTPGDLRVILTRNPLSILSGYKNGFEWHAIIEAIDGGLIQSDDEFMYVAPENGYQPRIQIDMPAAATNWANIYNISFFAKTRGGAVYSRVKFVFRVDSPKPQTGFTITSSANPNSSRNLQP